MDWLWACVEEYGRLTRPGGAVLCFGLLLGLVFTASWRFDGERRGVLFPRAAGAFARVRPAIGAVCPWQAAVAGVVGIGGVAWTGLGPDAPPQVRVAISVGVVFAAIAVVAVVWGAAAVVGGERRRGRCCVRCGYEVGGVGGCSECGGSEISEEGDSVVARGGGRVLASRRVASGSVWAVIAVAAVAIAVPMPGRWDARSTVWSRGPIVDVRTQVSVPIGFAVKGVLKRGWITSLGEIAATGFDDRYERWEIGLAGWQSIVFEARDVGGEFEVRFEGGPIEPLTAERLERALLAKGVAVGQEADAARLAVSLVMREQPMTSTVPLASRRGPLGKARATVGMVMMLAGAGLVGFGVGWRRSRAE